MPNRQADPLDISRDMDMIRRFLRSPEANRGALREMNAAISKPVQWRPIADGFAFAIFGEFGSVMVADNQFEIFSRDSTVGEIVSVRRPRRFPSKAYELEYWNDIGILWASYVDAFGLERLEIGDDALDQRDMTLCAIVRYLVGQINGA